MAFLERFPKTPSMEDLKTTIDKFINGQSLGRKFLAKHAAEVAHSGMYILRHMPSVRDSVFEYISAVYEDFVKDYMVQMMDPNVSLSTIFENLFSNFGKRSKVESIEEENISL